jgi:hypothetical protein
MKNQNGFNSGFENFPMDAKLINSLGNFFPFPKTNTFEFIYETRPFWINIFSSYLFFLPSSNCPLLPLNL